MTQSECEKMLARAMEHGHKEAKTLVDSVSFGTKEAAQIMLSDLEEIISNAFMYGFDYACRKLEDDKQ